MILFFIKESLIVISFIFFSSSFFIKFFPLFFLNNLKNISEDKREIVKEKIIDRVEDKKVEKINLKRIKIDNAQKSVSEIMGI